MENEDFSKYIKGYPEDHVLIEEGSDTTDFFYLIEGSVGIWKGESEKRVKVAEITQKGSFFGEMSFIIKEPRTASIISQEKAKVLQFPGEMLDQLMLKQPTLSIKICKALAIRLKGATTQSEEVAQHIGEVRNDASSSQLEAKESYKTIFILLTAIQEQFQHPLLKAVIEIMTTNKLLQGKGRHKINSQLIDLLPEQLVNLVKKSFPQEIE